MWQKYFFLNLSQFAAIAKCDPESHAGHCSFTFADSNPHQQWHGAQSR